MRVRLRRYSKGLYAIREGPTLGRMRYANERHVRNDMANLLKACRASLLGIP